MSITQLFTRVRDLNQYIEICPDNECPFDENELMTILEAAIPRQWLTDLQKHADYATMTFVRMHTYLKLLESIDVRTKDRTHRQGGRGQGRHMYRTRSTGRGHCFGQRGQGRGDGGNAGGGAAGGDSNTGHGRGRGQAAAPRCSNRRRGPYCPHCRTNDHDVSTCAQYQTYLCSVSRGGGGGPCRDEAHHLEEENTSQEVHVLDVESSEEEVYVLTRNLPQDSNTNEDVDVPPSSVIQIVLPHDQGVRYKALLDSGASISFCLPHAAPPDTEWIAQPATVIHTKTGAFQATSHARFSVILPDFSMHREVEFTFTRDDTPTTTRDYDFILGHDFLAQVGIVMDFSAKTVIWDDIKIPMYGSRRNVSRPEPELMTKYAMDDVIELLPKHLSNDQAWRLAQLLMSFKPSFQGGIGRFPGPPYDLTLTNDQPIHLRPFPVPHSLWKKTREEVDRMVKFGILKPIFHSTYSAPSFPIVKPNGSVRIVTDFRQLNKLIVRHPYPLPKISDLYHCIDGYDHASQLDLSLGFYHVELSERSKVICATSMPWGKYAYQ